MARKTIFKRTILNEYHRGGLHAIYRQEEETGVVELLLLPDGVAGPLREDCAVEPLVQLKLVEEDYPIYFSSGRTMRGAPSTLSQKLEEQKAEKTDLATTITTTLRIPQGLRLTHTLTLYADNPAAEVRTAVANEGQDPLTLEMLSSFNLGCLSPLSTGLAPGSLVIHRMRSNWSAEGRLVSEAVEDLQLEPSWQYSSANSIRFGSIGSYPVRGFVPFCGVEDKAHGLTWAAATTQGSSWQMEVYRRDLGLSLSGGLADREFGHWTKTLAPGEAFDAPKAVVTVVRGGVDEAAQNLTENLRRTVEPKLPASERSLPVLFNEFCSTWGCPTEETVLTHIKSLKGRGLGYYVIDAGWFTDGADSGSDFQLGRWELSSKSFPHGLRPIVDAIHEAGMRAGIWFEFEIAGRDEPSCFNKAEWLLKRNGRVITNGNRRFWDMRMPEVQEYLAQRVIAFLRDNGLDYMKVDYNDTIGIGCDGAESLGEGLRQQILASREFFARVRRELPDLVLELCASGGHRLCHDFLEQACMASFSDAHECDEIPIIAANMHRILLPRQSQIWAVVREGQPVQKLYYQICSGLLGRLCFSGEPQSWSDEQWAVMEQGVRFYALAAPVIDRGRSSRLGQPVFSYRAPTGWQAISRRGDTRTLLVLHTFGQAPDRLVLPAEGGIAAVFARPGLGIRPVPGGVEITGLRDFDAAALLLDHGGNL